MRLLQVTSFYPPVVGGMETVVQDLAEGLADRGDQVTVLCAALRGRGTRELRGGVEVIRAASLGKLLSQPLTPLLPLTLHRLAERFDLVHLHMPNPLAEAAVLSLRPRTPVIVTYHADIVRQRRLKPIYAPLRTAILDRSRQIVVPTENHIRYSEVLPAYREKCVVVPFGIARARYTMNGPSRALAEELQRRYGRFVLFVGRLVYYKGVVELIEAMRGVPASLVIVGDGPLYAEAKRRIAELGLGARVFMTGALPQPELNAHFQAAELLVLPSVSRAEGFGMTLLEAMLFGKPLVTTQLPSGMSLVNVDGETGLQVPPHDPEALGRALTELLADDSRRAVMGAAARKRVDAVFTAESMVDGYRRVYERALA